MDSPLGPEERPASVHAPCAKDSRSDAADVDDLGSIERTDAVYLLNPLFLGGTAPPAPYPDAGEDRTDDGLGCRGF